MKKNSIPQFTGVIASFIVIWLVNDIFLVDSCLDNGGSFLYRTGECLLANGEVTTSTFGSYLIALYFVLALSIAYGVSSIIRKVFKIDY